MRNFKLDIVDRAFELVQIDTDVNRMGTSLTRLRLASEHLLDSLSWLCASSLGARPRGTALTSGATAATPSPGELPVGYQRQQQRATRSAASAGLAAIG